MRYFFDLEDDNGLTKDTDGLECGTFEQMRHRAMAILAEVAANNAYNSDTYRLSVRVRDRAETPLYSATLKIEGAPDGVSQRVNAAPVRLLESGRGQSKRG